MKPVPPCDVGLVDPCHVALVVRLARDLFAERDFNRWQIHLWHRKQAEIEVRRQLAAQIPWEQRQAELHEAMLKKNR